MVAPVTLIAEWMALPWGGPRLEPMVFGTDDPGLMVARLDGLCRSLLGSGVADGLFHTASVGCVTGLRLEDGRSVVVKAYQARWRPPFLAAVAGVQAHLAEAGFPCPRPLGGPASVGGGWATVETYLPDPGQPPIEPAMSEASAAGLARVVELCRSVRAAGLSPHPMDSPDHGIYPEPHNPIFDFEATAAGAGWIDDLAVAAKRLRDGREEAKVVAHTDWSARNVRLRVEGVAAAYDWDSLALVTEPTAVGQAAATWSGRGEGDEPMAPSAEEVAAYVAAYEAGRGRSFTVEERRAAGAAALWALAYTARCEHALAALVPDGAGPQRAIGRLRLEGDRLLTLDRLV
ncbi:MAG TPA: phosphotransferase [Acidimicrobiales bacterium]|nr:phosphotransferase [Acidimicrobiales bacterium]